MKIPATMDTIRKIPCLLRYRIPDILVLSISNVLGSDLLILAGSIPVSAPGFTAKPKINPKTIATELMIRKYRIVFHTMLLAFLIPDSWQIPYMIAMKIMGRMSISRIMKKYRLTIPS
jgi:hypothetical protein